MKLFLIVLLLIGCEWESKKESPTLPEPQVKPEIIKRIEKEETKADLKEETEERSSGWLPAETSSEESKGRPEDLPKASKASPDSTKYKPKDCKDKDLSEVEVNLCNYINSKIKEKE